MLRCKGNTNTKDRGSRLHTTDQGMNIVIIGTRSMTIEIIGIIGIIEEAEA